MSHTRTVRLSDGQRRKLKQIAEALGISPNATVGQLIDNAEIQPVQTMAAVPKLPSKANGRSVQLSREDATAIVA